MYIHGILNDIPRLKRQYIHIINSCTYTQLIIIDTIIEALLFFSYAVFFIHSFSLYLFQVMSMRLLCILLVNSTEWNMNAHFISKLYLTFTYKLSLAILDNLFDFLAFLFALSPNLALDVCVRVCVFFSPLLFCVRPLCSNRFSCIFLLSCHRYQNMYSYVCIHFISHRIYIWWDALIEHQNDLFDHMAHPSVYRV